MQKTHSSPFPMRWIFLIPLFLGPADLRAAGPSADLETFEKEIQPLMEKYCVACHGPDKVKAELRIDELNPDLFGGFDAEHWEEVYNQLSIGEMPPYDEPQPSSKERDVITAWLADELRAAAAAKRSTGGSNVVRRLTRYEYNNTLRDLLGLDLDFAKNLPPEGAAKEGFVNNSDVLTTSGLHIEYFQRIGAEAIRRALVLGDEPEAFVLEFSPLDHLPKAKGNEGELSKAEKKKRNRGPKGPVIVSGGELSDGLVTLPSVAPPASDSKKPFQNGAMIRVNTQKIPTEGPLRITVRARSNAEPIEAPQLAVVLGHDAGNSASPLEYLGSLEVSGGKLRDYTFEGLLDRFPLSGGTLKTQFVVIQSRFDAGTAEVETLPSLSIDTVKIEAGAYGTWPPKSRTRILVSDDIREVLSGFMKRAYRRPATKEEIERMTTLYETLREGGVEHEDAVVETLAAVLAAPGFLLLAEPSADSERRQLNDWELASRLSYFLWSTMPDEQLFDLAESGKLRDPAVLASEVGRMLADEKAEAFFENFTTQWLHLDAIYNVAINPEFFPGFQEPTKDVMVAETVAFFTELMKSNRSALDLIDSQDAMLNGKLAELYGIPGVAGEKMRLVSLPADSHRGGILTHGSILTANSSGDDTHPILRGVWVLERLLGDPPPPPPPAVPTLAESDDTGERQSLKQKLEAHRDQEACATCHMKIDPWGVAFENYDGIGVWRDSTAGEEPAITELTEPPADGDHYFPSQEGIPAAKLDTPAEATAAEKQLIRAVNTSLESLQRPHNHLRKLGSEGKGDQLVRFLGYIDKREPVFESAVDKLLIETKQNRREFNKAFREQNAEILASNAEIRRKALAVAPKDLPSGKSNSKQKPAPIRGQVDPSTELADGTKIENLDALKAYLLEHKRDQFSETVVRKMMGYALGRYLDFTDTETVDALNAEFAANDYRMQHLVELIVLSDPFQTK